MRSLRSLAALNVFLGLVACARTPSTPGPITWTPRASVDDGTGQLPDGLGTAVPASLHTDVFITTGPAVPGTASMDAIVWDPLESELPPFDMSAVGTFDTSVNGVAYHATDGDGVAMLYTDHDGDRHIVLTIFSDVTTSAGVDERNVAVILNASDYAPGAVVALDGDQRMAIFAAGPDTEPDPTAFAVATAGTVTFGSSGSLALGDHVTATLEADFAPAFMIPEPVGTPIVAGGYELALDPAAEVICGGSMAGHEAAFARITRTELGVTDGTVTLALATDQLSIEGVAVGTRWGTPALLDAIADPADTFVATADETGDGPDATTLAGSYVMVESLPDDATLVHATFGLSYLDPIGDGGCDVAFHAELRAR
jgi:hypothetical protein